MIRALEMTPELRRAIAALRVIAAYTAHPAMVARAALKDMGVPRHDSATGLPEDPEETAAREAGERWRD